MFKPFVYVRTSRNIQIIVSDIQYRPAYEKCVNRLTLYLNPNCISGGGGILGNATQKFVKSACVLTIITLP